MLFHFSLTHMHETLQAMRDHPHQPSSSRMMELSTPYIDEWERNVLATAAERAALKASGRPTFTGHPDPAPLSHRGGTFGMADVHGRTDDDVLQREFARSVHLPVGGSAAAQVSGAARL
jgi:hypothetical protein